MPANNTHPHTQKRNNASSTNKQMDIESVKHWQEGLDPPMKPYRDISGGDTLVIGNVLSESSAYLSAYLLRKLVHEKVEPTFMIKYFS